MTKNRLIAGVALIVLLGLVGAIAAFVVDSEQSPEAVTSLSIRGKVVVEAYHYNEATGTYDRFYYYESSNTITIIGRDYIAQQLGGTPSDEAKWISLSLNTADPPPNTWEELGGGADDEIISGGLERAVGTYDHTAGTNTWTIEAEFTASATHDDVQQTGLQWVVTVGSNGNLMAANHFTPVTLTSGDALTITWTLTLS